MVKETTLRYTNWLSELPGKLSYAHHERETSRQAGAGRGNSMDLMTANLGGILRLGIPAFRVPFHVLMFHHYPQMFG